MSTAIAIISAVIALGALVLSWLSYRASRDSADAAAKSAREAAHANQLAEQAEARAARAEQRSTERRDVQWEPTWIPGKPNDVDRDTLSFRNAGADTAYEVQLIVDGPDNQRLIPVEMTSVPPTERIGIRLHTIAGPARERAQRSSGASLLPGMPGVLVTSNFRINARITWRSPAGVWDVASWPDFLC